MCSLGYLSCILPVINLQAAQIICLTAAVSWLALKQIQGLMSGSEHCYNLVSALCPSLMQERQMAE